MGDYKFNLNTYKYPPREHCTLTELEKIGEERLQLYKIMDEAVNSDSKPNSKQWDEYIQSKIERNNLRTYIILLNNNETDVGLIRARRNDHIAHWLLSLCYCRSNALRYFFMCCELYWFIMLYKRMKKEDINDFLIENGFNYIRVSLEEKDYLMSGLSASRNLKQTVINTNYYKTKFTEIINLVKVRQVYLYKGFAYFPDRDIIFCIKNKLWKQFNQQLLWTSKMIPTALKEDRILDFLTNMPLVRPTNKCISDTVPKISVDNINEIADKHFPLCMESIHKVLRREHHLKYDSKMQYGVFLKCLGLEYEDAMTFWKNEFTEKMSSDKYDRKYSYLFKHQYGKVGGMIDYKPYSCNRIQDMCPGPGQHHGCPFKHWDMDRLLDKCENNGVDMGDVNDIKNLVVEGRFNEACTVYFYGRHKTLRDGVIESPNQYFKESYETEGTLDVYFGAIFEDCGNEDYI